MKLLKYYYLLAVTLPLLATAQTMKLSNISDFIALSKQHRVDLYWNGGIETYRNHNHIFEIQRAENPNGPFLRLHKDYHRLPAYSDFIGGESKDMYYRVRSVYVDNVNSMIAKKATPWSNVVKAQALQANPETLLDEVQEASFRYFYNHSHPTSGLPKEGGYGWSTATCSTASIGMSLFNMGVGVEREFISREEGSAHVLKMLRFLQHKAEKFHGCLPHWIHGETGKVMPFGKKDNGADLVETAFAAEGFLFAREFFNQDNPNESEIRLLADMLFNGIEWSWFRSKAGDGSPVLLWHWSPDQEWVMNMPVKGFNECAMTYFLAVGANKHAVGPEYYHEGWRGKHFKKEQKKFGVPLDLNSSSHGPLFFYHYSYMGLDPKSISFNQKSYMQIFENANLAQYKHVKSKAKQFKGYGGKLWGLTASFGPNGYSVHCARNDNGTITPTASLSSMPYLPEKAIDCMKEMFYKHGKKTWGPYGFFDAFNITQNWYSDNYIGIDVGPIAPMIENYRTGLCWKYFMKAPEIQRAIQLLGIGQAQE